MQEAIILILNRITEAYPETDSTRLINILDEVLHNYDLVPKEIALVPINDIRDKIIIYLSSKKLDGLANSTLLNYKRFLMMFATQTHKNIIDIDTMDIRRFLAGYGVSKNISKSTMGNAISMLKSFFTWLVDLEYITKNPTRMIKATKQDRKLRKSLTEEELERLRDACTSLRERAIIEMYYATGCRLSELCHTNISDIDWMLMSFHVIGKGNKERLVYFNSIAKLYLRKYLSSRKNLQDGAPLFVSGKAPSGRLSGRSVQVEIHNIAKRAGFDRPIFPHLLRHTAATLGLKHGMSLTSIQTILGHSDPRTSLIYAAVDSENVRHDYRQHMGQ